MLESATVIFFEPGRVIIGIENSAARAATLSHTLSPDFVNLKLSIRNLGKLDGGFMAGGTTGMAPLVLFILGSGTSTALAQNALVSESA
jgi:hypothetical protein